MRTRIQNPIRRLAVAMAVLALGAAGLVQAADAEAFWPRRVTAAPHSVALYEPTIESYENDWAAGYAAVSVSDGSGEPVFGAAWFGLLLTLNADRSLGRVTAFRLDEVRFPQGEPLSREALERMLASSLTGVDLAMAPLQQSLERARAATTAAEADQNVVPDILFTTAPVALIRLDGEPELQAIPGSDVMVAVNSTATLLQHGVNGVWYMPVGGRWLTAPALAGPWQATALVPEAVAEAVEMPAEESPEDAVPAVVVVTRATEVIQTDGEPRYTLIPGTDLLYVNNTDADVLLDMVGRRHYALLAGRWFAAVSLEHGPWETVPADRLPASFAAIPPTSSKYGILAHVAGTVVAQEAVRDAAVPRVQKVSREPVDLTVVYEGEPEFVSTGVTQVTYAVNTPWSVLWVDPYYYLCHDGVWYSSFAATGPWMVSVSVPGVIYSVPPSCPVYPVTYVRVYDWTPSYVHVGFTAGYVGWYVGWSGLVFGFSYYDDAWWRGHHRGHYHHSYRSGFRPYHSWHHYERSPRRSWSPPLRQPMAHLAPRPGPELHRYSRSRPAERRPEIAGRPRPSRRPSAERLTPTRYSPERVPLDSRREAPVIGTRADRLRPTGAAGSLSGRPGAAPSRLTTSGKDAGLIARDDARPANPAATTTTPRRNADAGAARTRPEAARPAPVERPTVKERPAPTVRPLTEPPAPVGRPAPVQRPAPAMRPLTAPPEPAAPPAPVQRPAPAVRPLTEPPAPVGRPAPVQRPAPAMRPLTEPPAPMERPAPTARPAPEVAPKAPERTPAVPAGRTTAPRRQRPQPVPATPAPAGAAVDRGDDRPTVSRSSPSLFTPRDSSAAARETTRPASAGLRLPTVSSPLRREASVSAPKVSAPVISRPSSPRSPTVSSPVISRPSSPRSPTVSSPVVSSGVTSRSSSMRSPTVSSGVVSRPPARGALSSPSQASSSRSSGLSDSFLKGDTSAAATGSSRDFMAPPSPSRPSSGLLSPSSRSASGSSSSRSSSARRGAASSKRQR